MSPWEIEIERFTSQYIKVRLVNEKTGEKRDPIVIGVEDIETIIKLREIPSRIILPSDVDDGR